MGGKELPDVDEIDSIRLESAKRVGPLASSPVRNEPGFFELIDQFASDIESENRDAAMTAVVSMHMLSFLGLQNSFLWSRLLPLDIAIHNRDYLGFVRRGGLGWLVDFVRRVKVNSSETHDDWVAVAELHCPTIAGCEAVYTQKTTNSRDYFVELKVAGFGGGSGKSKEIGLGYQVPASAECRYIRTLVKVLVEACTSPEGDFERRTIVDIRDGYDTVLIPPELDRCRTPSQKYNILHWTADPFKADYLKPPAKATCTAAVGTRWKHSVGFEGSVLTVGWDVEIKVVKSFQYDYELVGPNRQYYGLRAPDTLGYAWTW